MLSDLSAQAQPVRFLLLTRRKKTMILALKKNIAPAQEEALLAYLRQMGVTAERSTCRGCPVLLLDGAVENLDAPLLSSLPPVEAAWPLDDPLPLASRTAHPADTVVQVGPASVGGGHFCLMAGPCAVESESQLLSIARGVRLAGAQVLRGGAFKPRTSPYDFSGLQKEGLALLDIARRETALPVVSEIMSPDDLPLFENVDLLQVGARNMQNYDLLRALGRTKKPVLLKRGSGATLRELLLSAEYILSGGNENVILCERGIRTFSDGTRSTLDLSAVPLLHEMTHLPVLVDPSHAVGRAALVPPMALAAAACGADGLLIEVHNDPLHALCDGAQALLPEDFAALARQIAAIREVTRR